jgi:hypothetical protein
MEVQETAEIGGLRFIRHKLFSISPTANARQN